jgi:hypothetical protein
LRIPILILKPLSNEFSASTINHIASFKGLLLLLPGQDFNVILRSNGSRFAFVKIGLENIA